MVQWEGQSFKSIFLSISTTCRVWFQEGGTGSGTDLHSSAVRFLFRVNKGETARRYNDLQ